MYLQAGFLKMKWFGEMIYCKGRRGLYLRLLTEIEKKYKLFGLPMPFGIFPTNLLNATEKALSEERFPKDGGIVPVRLFEAS